MKTNHKSTNPSSRIEAVEPTPTDSHGSAHPACEELATQPLKSVNATILQLENRLVTVRVPNAELAGLVGKEIKINGLKTISVHSVPSSEADNFKTDLTNALIYRIPEEDNMSSLKVAAVCELTWQ